MLNAIEKRKSPYVFDPNGEVSNEEMEALLLAASKAPSSFNEQPWRFAYAERDSFEFEEILRTLAGPNQTWAKDANYLLVAFAHRCFKKNDKPNRHFGYDTGQAMAFMSLEAIDRDIYMHQMGGFDKGALEEVYNVDSDMDAMSVTAIGRTGEDLSKKEFNRMTLDQLIIK